LNLKKNIGAYKKMTIKEYVLLLLLSAFMVIGIAYNLLAIAIIPIALLIAIILFIDIKLGYYLVVLIIPFSINLPISFLHITLNLPLEPLLLILFIATLYKIAINGIDIAYIKQPLSILFILFSILILLSSLFSTHKLISLRMCFQTFAYIIPAYWGILLLSKDDKLFIRNLLILPVISFSFICFINFIRHSAQHFDRAYAYYVAKPFYSDHTIYATMAALMIPIAFIFMTWYFGKNIYYFLSFLGILIVTLSGLLLSYSRAGIISLFVAFGLYFFIRLKISWWFFVVFIGFTLTYVVANQDNLLMSLKHNQTESKTRKTNLSNQVKSITNVNNDVSNLERLNRWKSAFRMIQEKPYLGFGYGMYQYEYFPYQKESETTTISIRNPQTRYAAGTGGTAHSEYLLLTSENGLFCGITYISLLITSIILSIKNIRNIPTHHVYNYISIGIAMSITTYIVHGFFNNFLDTSKINVIFFVLLASITSISVQYAHTDSKNIISI
jgi:putative inorganic carbon (HCO3(-)) transporter